MVILNIPKNTADVNLFQIRINILLIFNNPALRFLDNMTSVFRDTVTALLVKVNTITKHPKFEVMLRRILTAENSPEIDTYIKGIVNISKIHRKKQRLFFFFCIMHTSVKLHNFTLNKIFGDFLLKF